MCGIFGSVGPRLSRAQVLAALAALRHRGPDGWGVWTGDPGSASGTSLWPPEAARPWPCTDHDLADLPVAHHVLLVNTRLGLCGSGDTSRQPMASETGAVITFNGEIYNHARLRIELEHLGRRFRSDSDTEVLLAGVLQWGRPVVRRLEGPFAFAVWDPAIRRLIGARDRFGEKPLYVTHDRVGGAFAFSSTPRALFATGLAQASLRDDVAAGYLLHRVPPPPGASFFDDIRQIPPGCTFEYDPATGRLDITPFTSPDVAPQRDLIADETTLRHALTESLRLRRRANSPVALCLSGGVDSANLTAAADSPLTCYSLTATSMAGPLSDESQEVRAVAAATPHTQIQFLSLDDEITYPDFLRFMADHDEPPLNSGSFLQWLLMRRIAQTGTRAVVTGEGADELFWGYPWHIPTYSRDPHWDGVWRDDFGGRLPSDPTAAEEIDVDELRDRELFRTRLPQHLRDDDTNSMAHGVEIRTPYLDSAVVDYAMSLPASACFREQTTKYPVRAAFADVLPPHVAWGKIKRGLYVDCTAQWSDQLSTAARQALETSPVISRVADVDLLGNALRGRRMSRASIWRLVALAHTERMAADRVAR